MEPDEHKPEKAKNILRLDMTIAGIVLLLVLINGITFFSGLRWIGHAATGVTGLILVGGSVIAGAVLKGRVPGLHIQDPFHFHRRISIWLVLFLAGAFVLGILTTMEHGEPLLESVHGVTGAVVLVLGLFQLIPSLLIKNRAGIKLPHRITGYALVLVTLLQNILGLQAAGYL